MYDQTKTLTLTGKLTRFVLGANHAQLLFELLGPDGKPQPSAPGLWGWFFFAALLTPHPRHTNRPQSRQIPPPADSDHDVLLSIQHVGHRGAGLAGRHIHGPHLFAGSLIVCAEHGAALAVRRCEYAGLAGNDECLCDERADNTGAAGTRNVASF